MGTSNFNSNHTSCTYVVTLDDDFVWEDIRSNISYELDAIDKSRIYHNGFMWEWSSNDNIRLHEELRSYPATSIGWFYTTFDYYGIDFEISFIPKTVSGYYSDMNLDFEIQITADNYNYVEAESFTDAFTEDVFKWNEFKYPGLTKARFKDIIIKIESAIETGSELLENVFKQFSDGYQIAAQFSNGETIYTKCKAA